jgi:hypothetical protein
MAIKDKIAAIIVLTISSVGTLLFLYVLIPHLSIHLVQGTSTAKVIDWRHEDDDIYIVYTYLHENKSYTDEIDVKRPKRKEFESKSRITIHYSKIFPNNNIVDGIRDTDDLFLILGLAVAGYSAYRSILLLSGKISESDYLGSRGNNVKKPI